MLGNHIWHMWSIYKKGARAFPNEHFGDIEPVKGRGSRRYSKIFSVPARIWMDFFLLLFLLYKHFQMLSRLDVRVSTVNNLNLNSLLSTFPGLKENDATSGNQSAASWDLNQILSRTVTQTSQSHGHIVSDFSNYVIPNETVTMLGVFNLNILFPGENEANQAVDRTLQVRFKTGIWFL